MKQLAFLLTIRYSSFSLNPINFEYPFCQTFTNSCKSNHPPFRSPSTFHGPFLFTARLLSTMVRASHGQVTSTAHIGIVQQLKQQCLSSVVSWWHYPPRELIPPGEKENHLQKWIGRGYVSSQEGKGLLGGPSQLVSGWQPWLVFVPLGIGLWRPLPNGLFMAYKWGWSDHHWLPWMILQAVFNECKNSGVHERDKIEE